MAGHVMWRELPGQAQLWCLLIFASSVESTSRQWDQGCRRPCLVLAARWGAFTVTLQVWHSKTRHCAHVERSDELTTSLRGLPNYACRNAATSPQPTWSVPGTKFVPRTNGLKGTRELHSLSSGVPRPHHRHNDWDWRTTANVFEK